MRLSQWQKTTIGSFFLKRTIKGTVIFFALSLFSWPNFASEDFQFFTFHHPSCEAIIFLEFDNHFNDRDQQRMRDKILETTTRRGFKAQFPSNENRVIPANTLYFKISMERVGFIYKGCRVEAELFSPEGNRPGPRDRRLYGGDTTRQFPRVTFKGNERCVRAVDDTFVHIAHCRR